MRRTQKLRIGALAACCLSMFSLGANDLRIAPQNGLYRMWCPFDVSIQYNTQDNTMAPSNFELRLPYGGTGEFTLSNFSWGPVVDAGNSTYLFTPDLYLNGVLVGGNPKVGTLANRRFSPKNISSANLSFAIGTTAEQGLRGNSGTPLPGVNHVRASYFFQPLPCVDDTNAPTSTNFSPNISNTTKVYHTDGLHFWLREPNGPDSAGYMTDPANASNIANFLDSYPGDNQRGVDIDTLELSLYRSIPAVEFITQNFGPSQVNSSTRNVQMLPSAQLTRNRNIRDYELVITNIPANYGIEKEMNLDVSMQDHAGNAFTHTYTFNSPVGPRLTDKELEGATEVLPLTDIRCIVRDDRAGVDPDTIVLSVYNQSSGDELVGRFAAPPIV